MAGRGVNEGEQVQRPLPALAAVQRGEESGQRTKLGRVKPLCQAVEPVEPGAILHTPAQLHQTASDPVQETDSRGCVAPGRWKIEGQHGIVRPRQRGEG